MRIDRLFLCSLFLSVSQFFAAQEPAEPQAGQSLFEKCPHNVQQIIMQDLTDKDVAHLSEASRTEYAFAKDQFDKRATHYWAMGDAQFSLLDGDGEHYENFLPQGECLISRLPNGDVRLWNLKTGKVSVNSCLAPMSANFSPDYKLLGTPNKIWSVAKGAIVKELLGGDTICSASAFSPDGTRFAFGLNRDGVIDVWNLKSGERRTFIGHTGLVQSLSFSPDGKWLASSAWDNSVRLWDLETSESTELYRRQAIAAFRVLFLPNSRLLVYGNLYDFIIRIWDVEQRREIKELQGYNCIAYNVAASSDGRLLAVGYRDAAIVLWNVESGQKINTLKGHKVGNSSLSVSPDGKLVVSRAFDRTCRLWYAVKRRGPSLLSRVANAIFAMNFI